MGSLDVNKVIFYLKKNNQKELALLLAESEIIVEKPVEGGCFDILEGKEFEIFAPRTAYKKLMQLDEKEITVMIQAIHRAYPHHENVNDLEFFALREK